MFDTKTICGAIGKTEAAVRHAASGLPMESRAVQRVSRAWTLRDGLAITIVDALVGAGMPAATACRAVQEAADLFERIVADDAYEPWTVVSTIDGATHVELFADAEDALAAVLAVGNAQTLCWHDLVRGALVRLVEAQRAVNRGRVDA